MIEKQKNYKKKKRMKTKIPTKAQMNKYDKEQPKINSERRNKNTKE